MKGTPGPHWLSGLWDDLVSPYLVLVCSYLEIPIQHRIYYSQLLFIGLITEMIKLIVVWVAAQCMFTTHASNVQAYLRNPLVGYAEDWMCDSPSNLSSTWTFRWTQGGNTTGFTDNPLADETLTDWMKIFKINNNITQAQMSIAKNGSQMANYAFNYNNPAMNADVHVEDHFLLASVSKIYCIAAIKFLINSGQLSANTSVYTRLGYTPEFLNGTCVFDITVQNLLEHLGGDDSWHQPGKDPVELMRQIALEMNKGAHPAIKREIVEWKLKQPLDFTPGNVSYCLTNWQLDFCYSNYGCLLLSYLVENVTGVE